MVVLLGSSRGKNVRRTSNLTVNIMLYDSTQNRNVSDFIYYYTAADDEGNPLGGFRSSMKLH